MAVRSQAARCSALKAGSLGELKERAKIFASLWSEAKERERATASLMYLGKEACILAEYLVSLALEGRIDEVSKLLDEEGWLLRRFPDVGVAVRLLLEHLGVKVEKPEAREVAEALRSYIWQDLRPAFNLLMGLPGGALDECSELKAKKKELCLSAVAAIRGDEDAVITLKIEVIDRLGKRACVAKLLLSGIPQEPEECEAVKRFFSELLNFIEERGAGDVVQLWAPAHSSAAFVLMLWALSSGDEELARAHAKLVSITIEEKLLRRQKLFRRLFREAAEARGGEELKLALLKLFYLHF